MLIRRPSHPREAIVYRTEGFGKKQKQSKLLQFVIKDQFFVFDLDSRRGVPMMLECMLATCSAQNDVVTANDCEWSPSDLESFIQSIEAAIERSSELLKADLTLSAELKVRNDVYVTMKCLEVPVSDGMFSGSHSERHIFIYFGLFGNNTDWVRWVPQMLDPIRNVIRKFESDREAFEASMDQSLRKSV